MASGWSSEMSEQAKPKHYKDLLIWQKGMFLTKLIYKLTAAFPPEERFGLTSQLRRAAVSVPSNIAEGQARHGSREFLHFLSNAEGSLAELETQLILAVDLSLSKKEEVESALNELSELQKMIAGLKRKLPSRSPLATRHSPLAAERR